jgi:WD40 repeat protein/Ca2+-binding EF-hand superfamily protein|uniref:Cilia- and flagella-associated protein 251 n=1 Tax=Eutreptiella gymnastica TaxID=73025 RepID=A0A7S4GA80_9EUGL|mmetsp:Transcript_70184/g.117067  ORF Transcript_70184/g.117067 Transcript_70184/m.117067 type:complete len:930 (+) Transcript_70184:119-2908(+)|eukprot:CAMPEP_0174282414 /NCGR_PEP_ID=MMETSP0809-20121228/2920_1 /TAXON_ID=73025 ORGANISM="Eutreptiella gymnastica-like, Strain CCMP1594" /NCGR_SAMPLE_ID=MMETSP0809 /ASSEMBLY_ACC=CAM_ASM_000658 /LENGTH=929 /DNA_ID=CAMNT_0015376597 /DNA_START=119 /DNA_END=2908 /DNA_ORIENTATION=+
MAEGDVNDVQKVLSLQWVFGLNKDEKGTVHNLSDGKRKAIFYYVGHTAVIYDVDTHKQRLLQGHKNPIISSCVSEDRRFVVTADLGEDSMLIVWDTYSFLPIKSISLNNYDGVLDMDLTNDAMYIVTLSKEMPQYISLWEWTAEDGDVPRLTTQVTAKDLQTCVRFNPDDYYLVVTNGLKRVIFWSWAEGSWKYYSPPISMRDFKQPVGDFTQSVFIPGTDLAATATVDGDICMWSQVKSEKKTKATDKTALKVVRVHNSAINYLTTVGPYIVTGGVEGFVRFFDIQLRIVAWFEELSGGPIISISFDRFSQHQKRVSLGLPEIDSEETPMFTGDEFQAPDFVVSTANAMVIDVPSASFATSDQEYQRGRLLVQGQDQPIMCLAAHPALPRLAIAGYSGNLHLWEYSTKKVLLLSIFKNLLAHCMAFDPKAQYLAIGFTNGVVKILDANTLEEMQSFRTAHDCIIYITFSHDSSLLAIADAENCVGLFRFTHRGQDPRKPVEWVYIGRNRSHRAPVTDIQFGVVPNGTAPRLMSIGEDKRLIEYNLADSEIEAGLRLRSAHKITQGAIPTAFLWHSAPLGDSNTKADSNQDVLVVATNEYKVKLFATDSNRQCIQTVLGPTYGGPLNKVLVITQLGPTGPQQYAIYTTHEKVVGLIKLPLDGNPRKAMGLLAHPMEISSATTSFDGRYVFTAGGRDCCVNQWAINGDQLKVQDGRPIVDHYIDVVEGGKDGDFMKEIIDYFYYAQIRSQGEETTAKRKIEGKIPFTQVPNLMRALGYYPSEKEIQNMTYEIYTRFEKIIGSEDIYIDFETFIRLYVNHRPVFGINKKNIENAFVAIGADPTSGVMDRDTLFNLLKTRGEPMHQLEVESSLKSLLGDEVTSVEMLEENITAKAFAENLLGFEDYEEAGWQEDAGEEDFDDVDDEEDDEEA